LFLQYQFLIQIILKAIFQIKLIHYQQQAVLYGQFQDILLLRQILDTEYLLLLGASSFHHGIDIGAPTGCKIVASFSGKVIYTDFYGANGFTVMIENGEYIALYSHVSPDFLVCVGQIVSKGQIIANVGPKNVYGVSNNKYKDSNR